MEKTVYFDMETNAVPAAQTEVISKVETRKIGRGKDALAITMETKIRVKKGTEIPVSDMKLDTQEDEKFFDEYRKQKSLIAPKEIKEIRETIGISQRGLANLVGWSSSTIERYEGGGIANPSNDRILRSLSNKAVVLEFFKNSEKVKYSSNDYESLLVFLDLHEKRSEFFQAIEVAEWFVAENLKEQVLDDESNPMTQMKLHKLVYYAQKRFMQTKGYPMFEENTLAFPHGAYYLSIRNKYFRKKYIFDQGELPSKEVQELYYDNQKVLNDNESVRNVLMQVWEEYGKYEATYLRKLNHQVGGAWYKNYREGQSDTVIPNQDILAEKA